MNFTVFQRKHEDKIVDVHERKNGGTKWKTFSTV